MFRSIAPIKAGDWHIELTDHDNRVLARKEVSVATAPVPGRPASSTGIWKVEREWDAAWERVFSFWISRLFRPLANQQNKGWKPLHQVLQNKTRNFLYNRLGHKEDNPKSEVHIRARADCGDLPYQLRAYFAWKFGLPFRFRNCNRGDSRHGPTCRISFDNLEDRYDKIANPVARFNAFIEESIAWRVHSGTMRTLPEDEGSDFYPIALHRSAIRPGTVFVDVGGHALMVSQWDRNGLFGVDGHPDKTVTRRRFSPKYFKYVAGTRTGGFKAFRPVTLQGERIVPRANGTALPSFSLEQYAYTDKKQFFDRMLTLMRIQNSGYRQL
ncbi:MAG: hypothetical protein QNJ97_01680 [Myxococcota bacterium]|nr:hypothetical protein [Myxococcota bacterium]